MRFPSALLLTALLAPAAAADDLGVAATFPIQAHSFALHPTLPRLYVSVPAGNSVAVIDTESLTTLAVPFVGSAPRGLALSEDASRLYVATSGATSIAVLDTATLQLLAPLPLPVAPSDVEVGPQGRVFATPLAQSGGIMQYDTVGGSYLGAFQGTASVYASGLLEISPDRETLYFANRGLSPGTLAAFDVSSPTPVQLYQNAHGSLGSNGQDLSLSHNGRLISYACGGGNFSYDIFVISTLTWGVHGSLACGPYPREITYAPNDRIAYVVHTGGEIDRFDVQTFLPLAPIPTVGEATELVVEHTGRYVFAAFDTQLRAYKTGFGPPGFAPFCPGDGSVAACPCGNEGTPGLGCGSSVVPGGAAIAPSGSVEADPVTGTDTVVLMASGLPLVTTVVFLQGSSPIAPTPFGDGLRCTGGELVRIAVVAATMSMAQYPGAGDPSVSQRGGVALGTGILRYYQAYYRDLNSFCTSAPFNVTSGVAIGW